MKKVFLIASLLVLWAIACKKEAPIAPPPGIADTPMQLTPYVIERPAHFPYMVIPEDNKPYVERIQLGRRLYYDPLLSNNGSSCASCHVQSKGFTKDDMFGGMPVLPHVNLAWTTNWMWDGAQKGSLEDVMLFEVKDFFATDLQKINSDSTYKSLFKKHYGVNEISYKNLAYALAQFLRTVNSGNSLYAKFLRGVATFNADQEAGRAIFFSEKGDCFHCHLNPLLTDNSFHNTGLDSPYVLAKDKGLYNVTGLATDMGKFRTPNLHNVALRKHFMHDGRFTTLEEVVDFYNSGVKKVNTLDPIMTKPGKENGLNLTPIEKLQLVAFLKTFTDTTFLTNPQLAAP